MAELLGGSPEKPHNIDGVGYRHVSEEPSHHAHSSDHTSAAPLTVYDEPSTVVDVTGCGLDDLTYTVTVESSPVSHQTGNGNKETGLDTNFNDGTEGTDSTDPETSLADENDDGGGGCCCCRQRRQTGCCEDEARWCRACGADVRAFGQEVFEIVEGLEVKRRVRQIFTVKTLKNTVPILKWIPHYTLRKLQCDIIAGLTVGLTVIPQSIAYAQVAGLDVQYGLYSAFVGCFVYAFLGSSKDVTVGPVAVMSLLVAELAESPVHGDATYAILVSLIGGCLQLAMGIFRLGFIVNYISHPVIKSFTTASGLTIAEGQFKKWLGLKNLPSGFFPELFATIENIPNARLYDFLMGIVCILLLRFLKEVKSFKLKKMKPSRVKRVLVYTLWLAGTARNAIVVILAAVLSAILLSFDIRAFSASNNMPPGLPPFEPPKFTLEPPLTNRTYTTDEIFQTIGTGFVIIPLMGFLEGIAIGKFFANVNGYKLYPNQELLALGVANILGSFVSAYPVTGSFTRSAINSQSGVKTPLGCVFTGLLVIISLLFLTPYFNYIPDATLAAIIISSVVDLIDFGLLKKLWRINKAEVFPWLLTCILGLVFGVETGIIVGIVWTLLMLVFPWGWPSVKVVSDEPLFTGDNGKDVGGKRLIVLSISHGTLFPGIEVLKDKICKKGGTVNSVVIDFTYVTAADYSTIEGLEMLMSDFHKKEAVLYFANMKPHVLRTFDCAKLKHFRHAPSVAEAVQKIRDEANPPRSTYQQQAVTAKSAADQYDNFNYTVDSDDDGLEDEEAVVHL